MSPFVHLFTNNFVDMIPHFASAQIKNYTGCWDVVRGGYTAGRLQRADLTM